LNDFNLVAFANGAFNGHNHWVHGVEHIASVGANSGANIADQVTLQTTGGFGEGFVIAEGAHEKIEIDALIRRNFGKA